jgi:lipoate-protein ligase A
VLGSTQRGEVVDAEAARLAGIEIVRRRSGGGSVLVTPDDPVWIDLWIPVDDELWSPDVTGAFGWVGSSWGAALARLGLDDVDVQESGPGACTRWSSLVCFGGFGAGEVGVGGRKVVGLSQRRNRAGAWFHTACVRHWDPTLLLDLLDLSPGERAAASEGLSAAVTGVADELVAVGRAAPSGDDIAAVLLAALP